MSNDLDQIAFEVETGRILEIISKEIYDSPFALLRENVQNAYDAVLMRAAQEGTTLSERSIEVTIEPGQVTIHDDGIGMNEETLRNNFWKAGSSGKKTPLASRAGVVGTFGIGAMANFGVCKSLRIETRSQDSDVTLISTAERAELRIGRDCIRLERVHEQRSPGTLLVASLDPTAQITPEQGRDYLAPYGRFLPVRLTVNGALLSQHSYEAEFDSHTKDTNLLQSKRVSDGTWEADLRIHLNLAGGAIVYIAGVSFSGSSVPGEMFLVQQGGQLMGYRNYFGLAPVPVGGHYQFGGAVNLAILQPTAGREALSRESIDSISRLLRLVEGHVSEAIAPTDAADRNPAFLQYVHASGRTVLAGRVSIEIQPDDVSVALADVLTQSGQREVRYYGGRDQAVLKTFASGGSCVLRLAQTNPRRSVQHRYLTSVLKVPEVPDRATVLKIFEGPELSLPEAATLLRITTTLAEDYVLPSVVVRFAEISHGVAILAEGTTDNLRLLLARNSGIVQPVLACHQTAYEVFGGFVKDFVRVHLYNHISQFVPSSTRQGANALMKLLQRNRELYRYEETELGPLDPLLADYLAGEISFAEVIQAAATIRPHSQTVTSAQVGNIEEQLPDIVDSPAPTQEETQQQYGAAPPILRPDVSSAMKVLLATRPYPQLNDFTLFLGLSDRLFARDGIFFHSPHTTKVIWGSHRVIYMFAHASGAVTMYYDIELKEPLHENETGGGGFATTTIITRNRIYVPVPSLLVDAFRVAEGAREFFVRFDVL